jgi:hypothetical protein
MRIYIILIPIRIWISINMEIRIRIRSPSKRCPFATVLTSLYETKIKLFQIPYLIARLFLHRLIVFDR